MKIAFFSSHEFEKKIFDLLIRQQEFSKYEIDYFDSRLTEQTISLARGYSVVSIFVSDHINEAMIKVLSQNGLKLLALRSAGFNHVDIEACKKYDINVVRVPAYSPYAVAEHALCLLLALNRKIHRAAQRVRELNFSLDGLVGFDIHGKNIGIIGTGEIGTVFAKIVSGFGVKIQAYDPVRNDEFLRINGAEYVSFDTLIHTSDIISLHCPLTPKTFHLIGEKEIGQMKHGVYLINTGRGGLIDTKSLIKALKQGKIGGAGLDVYEEEEGIFFYNLSEGILEDDVLARLLTFPNVLITAHQAFLTIEALNNIATTTMQSILAFEQGQELVFKVTA